MTNKKFVIGLDGIGIDEALRGIKEYQQWLQDKAQQLVTRLAQEGYNVASAGFQDAVYDGDIGENVVSIEQRGELTKAVVVIGETALFVEFGTGIYYLDTHPDKDSRVVGRGQYGKGHGSQTTWGFYGEEAGTNGRFATDKKGNLKEPHVVLTHGNPANMPMFSAAEKLRQDFTRIVQEVFA